MKFFIAITLIAAVASASYLKPVAVNGELSQISEIVAAINHPSTDPGTAALLEQLLLETLGLAPSPIAVGPAIVDELSPSPIAVGPEIIDFPVPDGGAVTALEPTPVLTPSPAIVAPVAPAASTPLVQIILNINAAAAGESPVAVLPEGVIDIPQPVIVVDEAPVRPSPVSPIIVPEPVVLPEAPLPVIVVDPVQVVDAAPEPIIIVTPVLPSPVVVPEPVLVGQPILPAPAVVLPETLN